MSELFMQILNMSITGSYCIIAVFLLRFLLKKQPKIFSYALWSIVLFRLICPISFESALSIVHTNPIPLSDEINQSTINMTNGLGVYDNSTLQQPSKNFDAASNIVHPYISDITTSDTAASNANHIIAVPAAPNVKDIVTTIWNKQEIFLVIWLAGVIVLLLYMMISSVKLKKELKTALPKEDYYIMEHLGTPFVFGLFSPKIYIPKNLPDTELSFILEHERTHIQRKDYIIKPLAFCVLSFHWFNPLVWLAFLYMCKDMEMSCDEAVIQKMGIKIKRKYTTSLLTIAEQKTLSKNAPLAFGEGNVKGRIKNILNYKKPHFIGLAAITILLICVSILLISNPKKQNESGLQQNGLIQPIENNNTSTFSLPSQVSDFMIQKYNSQNRTVPVYGKSENEKVKNLLKSYGSLDKLPDNTDDMLILSIKGTPNTARWETFCTNAENHIEDAIVILQYTTEGDGILTYLSYHDGQFYRMEDDTRDHFGEQGYFEGTGYYMMCYPDNGQLFYYLTNSEDITLQYIRNSMLSSVALPIEENIVYVLTLDYELLRNSSQKWKNKDLEACIAKAIISSNTTTENDAPFVTEAHFILKINETQTETVVYAHALYQEYTDAATEITERYLPVAITFSKNEDGTYTLKKYQMPEGGSNDKTSIKKIFPKLLWAAALDGQTYIKQLETQCKDKAIDYFE